MTQKGAVPLVPLPSLFSGSTPTLPFVPDRRKHRGAHPVDAQLFSAMAVAEIQRAVHDLSWLLSRGYPSDSAVALVGDRYRLAHRQRIALRRMACGDDVLTDRFARRMPDKSALDRVILDGFNVLITVESALGGAVVLEGRDGCYRDLAGLRGTYRIVQETMPAARAIGRALARRGGPEATWLLDRPVSNSGRLATLLREVAASEAWPWHVSLENEVDALLRTGERLIASADSAVLDGPVRWFNLARAVIDEEVPKAWVVRPGP